MHKILLLLPLAVVSQTRKDASKLRMESFPAFWAPDTVFDASFEKTSKLGAPSLQELRADSLSWAKGNLAMSEGDEVTYKNGYSDTAAGLHFSYMVKETQGMEIVNSIVSLTMDSSGNVLSQGNSWVKTDPNVIAKRANGITCKDAVISVGKNLGVTPDPTNWVITEWEKSTSIAKVEYSADQDVICRQKFYQTATGLKHIWDVTIDTGSQALNLMIDFTNGNVLGVADWVSHFAVQDGRLLKRAPETFQYRVIKVGDVNPSVSQPTLLTNPADLTSSPIGWHFEDKDITFGNNVFATENSANQQDIQQVVLNGKQATGNNFKYDFTFDDKTQSPSDYKTASITNVFYVTNTFHDIMYHYGFDEKAGNFQFNNLDKAESRFASDPVIALIQDGSGRNNANFRTPPDGSPGIMKMFIFDGRTANGRDGALDNSVVIHELMHGLSNRLTGGALQANCLQRGRSGGLGEGWSDVVAVVLEMQPADTRTIDKGVGNYVSNPQRGIRSRPYSTNLVTNDLNYASLQTRVQSHAVGEVWASMLFEVYWNMVDKLGFDTNFKTSSAGTGGNTKFLANLINGMKIQPCNPTFIQARNAIIAADRATNGGANICSIMRGFAKRGMGSGAQDGSTFVNDFTIPTECANTL